MVCVHPTAPDCPQLPGHSHEAGEDPVLPSWASAGPLAGQGTGSYARVCGMGCEGTCTKFLQGEDDETM